MVRYTFIPDASFVGTAFVNVTSNLLATQAHPVTLQLHPLNGSELRGLLGAPTVTVAGGVTKVELGPVQYGQPRHVVVQLAIPPGASLHQPYLTASMTFQDVTGTWVTMEAVGVRTDGGAVVEEQVLRSAFVDTVQAVLTLKRPPRKNAMGGMFAAAAPDPRVLAANKLVLGGGADPLVAAQNLVSALADRVRASASLVQGSAVMAALLEDIEGQFTIALSRDEYFQKWGRHYLPALARAHAVEQSNNFKDPGIQVRCHLRNYLARVVCFDLGRICFCALDSITVAPCSSCCAIALTSCF